MNRVILSLITVFACVGIWQAQDVGIVRGVVVDENGRPMNHVKVHLAETKPFVGHRIIDVVETDDEGEFAINKVAWGEYVVLGGKEEAGYPDTKLAFYSNFAVPKINVDASNSMPYVKLVLGPKAGILRVDSVMNAHTGKDVRSATITLRRADNPKLFMTTSVTGGTMIPIPADTDILIEVNAAGFKSWALIASSGNEQRVRVQPEEVYPVTVHLQPEPQ